MLKKLVTLVISEGGRWRIGFGDSMVFHYNLFILLEFLKSFKYVICLKFSLLDHLIYLFVFGCAGSLLLCWLSLVAASGGLHSSCNTRASHCGGFSVAEHGWRVHRLLQLPHKGSRAQAQ